MSCLDSRLDVFLISRRVQAAKSLESYRKLAEWCRSRTIITPLRLPQGEHGDTTSLGRFHVGCSDLSLVYEDMLAR